MVKRERWKIIFLRGCTPKSAPPLYGGVRTIEPPTKRPWGAVNMSFYDPDNNVIYFRQLQEE